METAYTAIVHKKVKSLIPVFDTKGRAVFLDPQGKLVPRNEAGELVGSGEQKFEVVTSETTDSPLTDEAGNVVEAGTPEALLRKVKDQFSEDENTEVLHVWIRETKTARELSGADLAAVK